MSDQCDLGGRFADNLQFSASAPESKGPAKARRALHLLAATLDQRVGYLPSLMQKILSISAVALKSSV